MKTVVTVVGARPQFVKAAVLSRVLREEPYVDRVREVLVHTGQHHDQNMSEIFFRDMMIPDPDLNLGIHGDTHGRMTGRMLIEMDGVIERYHPEMVVVYGDTNSTLAAALSASKLHVPVVHVEAGLRSADLRMPEEQNRILTDQISSVLACPTDGAVANLRAEGVVSRSDGPMPRVVANVGDIMLDAALFYSSLLDRRRSDGTDSAAGHSSFRLLTLHRAENTDDPSRLRAIFSALNRHADLPIVFPVHPRTRAALARHGVEPADHITMIDPIGYLEMIDLERRCVQVITDSGGVQKEAFFFGKPCITLRDTTEWVETVACGWNTLTGADPHRIAAALSATPPTGDRPALYGDGRTGERIARLILEVSGALPHNVMPSNSHQRK